MNNKKINFLNCIQNQRFFLQSFILNVICVFFYQIVCEPHFDTTKDEFLNNMLAGHLGKNVSCYGDINLFVGAAFKRLYVLIPQIPWYTVIQYVLVFICFFIIVYIIFMNNSAWGAYISSAVILIFLGYECYARISYMKTGALCTITGCFLFYYYLWLKRAKAVYLFGAIVLCISGYLWWDTGSLLALIFMVLPICARIIKLIKTKSEKKIIGKFIGSIGILLVGICLIFSIQSKKIEQMPKWKEYIEYQENLEYINHYGWPDYAENYRSFRKLKISKEQYQLLKEDETIGSYVVSLNKLEKIKKMVIEPEMSVAQLLKFTRTYPLHFFNVYVFFAFIILLYILYLSKIKRKKWIVAYLFFVVLIIYGLCYFKGIDQISVLNTSIWIMACIFLTIFIRNIELKDTELKKYYSFMIVVIILIAVNKGYSKITSVIGLEYRKQLTNFVTDIREDKSNTYITNNTTFLKRNLPFNIVDKGSLQNCMIANNDYILYNKKQKYMEEPIELVNNTNIRLLSTSYANDISKYLNKAYDAKTYVVQIGNLYNTSICMLRRGLPKLDTDSIKKAKSDIKMNIEIEDSKGDEESKVLNGYIYKNNTDSFAQKVYIEAYNRKDKIYTYYDVIQTENARCTDKMKGKFSAFSVEIPLSKMENYSVILEVDGTMYRVNINERW